MIIIWNLSKTSAFKRLAKHISICLRLCEAECRWMSTHSFNQKNGLVLRKRQIKTVLTNIVAEQAKSEHELYENKAKLSPCLNMLVSKRVKYSDVQCYGENFTDFTHEY